MVESESLSLSSPILTKSSLASKLSSAISDACTPVQYLSSLASALSRLMGYDAPKQVEVGATTALAPLAELMSVWASEEVEAGGAPQIGHDSISPINSPSAIENEKIPPTSLDAKGCEGDTQINYSDASETVSASSLNDLGIEVGRKKPTIIVTLD